jgi:hypothetical protein
VAGALIVTAELGPADFGWLDGLRRAHYPADRNRLPAHVTMFHALPPSIESELRTRLGELARQAPPTASVAGLMDLGGGVAFRIVSPGLDAIREELAEVFLGSLGAQDSGGWRPHVTIQNKVAPRKARALKESLERGFVSRPLAIHGFGLHRYLGGPWEKLALYPFRGVS